MYGFMSEKTQNKAIGCIASIIYMTMPYHLTDMYIRNALGEFLSYLFIPLVFWGIDRILNCKKGNYLLVIGSVGLILTHNLMTVLTAITAFVYLMIHIKQLRNKHCLREILISFCFILGISSFFWVPALETWNFADYEVYQENSMATKEEFVQTGLNLKDLLTANQETRVFKLGLPIIVILFLSLFYIPVLKERLKKDDLFFFLAGLLFTWMSTKYFPWTSFSDIFNILQFPWRLLVFSNFFFSITCARILGVLQKNLRFRHVISIVAVFLVSLIPLVKFLPTETKILDIAYQYLTGVSVNPEETMPAMGKGEYLPVNCNCNRTYLFFRENKVLILEGTRRNTYTKKRRTKFLL